MKNKIQYNIRFDKDFLDEVRKYAESKSMTVSDVIRTALYLFMASSDQIEKKMENHSKDLKTFITGSYQNYLLEEDK